MATWSMIDRHGEDGIYQDQGVLLAGVRWTSRVETGNAMDVQLYLYSPGLVSPLDPNSCEAIVTGGGWGKRVTVSAVIHPDNQELTKRTYCVDKSGFNGPSYKPLDVPLPEQVGDYEMRLLFLQGGADSTQPQFPGQTFGDWDLVSELKLPVTVTEEQTGDCSQNGDCPDGQVCDGGTCVAAGDGEACSSNADCPEGMVCENGRCVVPDGNGGGGGGDLPMAKLALVGAGAYYVSKQRKG